MRDENNGFNLFQNINISLCFIYRVMNVLNDLRSPCFVRVQEALCGKT
jgi:hypothetical protein